MKKVLLAVLVVMAIVCMAPKSEAYVYESYFPNGAYGMYFDSSDWDGYSHLEVTFGVDGQITGAVLDPYGVPQLYLMFDSGWNLYASFDGYNWEVW